MNYFDIPNFRYSYGQNVWHNHADLQLKAYKFSRNYFEETELLLSDFT